ncbi:MAG: hypothetical protein K2G92_01960, partial [Duncaniella sp.]|nr:hypothetical protein [Duncaniella sp.]
MVILDINAQPILRFGGFSFFPRLVACGIDPGNPDCIVMVSFKRQMLLAFLPIIGYRIISLVAFLGCIDHSFERRVGGWSGGWM